jgi:hypothetical protein
MMTLHERLDRLVAYLYARLREPITYIGLSKAIAAGSWAALDASSKGEIIMQAVIFGIGMVEALLPAGTLFRKAEDRKP